ncbi:deoxyribonuclease IV [Clostridia bacterium]|nr:deoxyribonuclease IV [Clostridia bacterium]
MILGSHLSIAKGYKKAGETAVDIGANTFQFFTRNPRGGKAKELEPSDLEALKKIMEEHHFGPLLAHAPYTLNLASGKEDVRTFGKNMMREDLLRMEQLPAHLYNFHPGSHVKDGVVVGIERIVRGLNEVVSGRETTTILLETMAGKGSEVGARFEELRSILSELDHPEKFGICLDTCHVYDAGYDLRDNMVGVLEEFDTILGLERLKAIHLNDSKYGMGSHKDRHAGIGEGELGMPFLLDILGHEPFEKIPFFLETPYDDEGHKREIAFLKEHLE